MEKIINGENNEVKVIKCIEPNDNIYVVRKIFDDLKIDKANYKWVISDLDLVPRYHGDYSGIGGEEKKALRLILCGRWNKRR